MTHARRRVGGRSSAAAAAALLLLPSVALAHAELIETSPEAGAQLDTPPAEVVLTFHDELLPTGSAFVVVGPDGDEAGAGELDLEVAGRNELRGPVDAEQPGAYAVRWSATARDGHADEGSFTFTVLDREPAEPPDTALPAPPVAPLAAAGLVLVALGLATLTMWRAARA